MLKSELTTNSGQDITNVDCNPSRSSKMIEKCTTIQLFNQQHFDLLSLVAIKWIIKELKEITK